MSVTINGTSGVTTPGITNSEGYTGDGLTIAAGAPAGALQIDSAGNAGLGVVPSAYQSGARAFQNPAGSLYTINNLQQRLSFNAYRASDGNDKYIASGFATEYRQGEGTGIHSWHTAPSGTAGNPITFTQAMTLDASGNLLVGKTASNQAVLGVQMDGVGGSSFTISSGNTLHVYSTAASNFRFYVNHTGQINATYTTITGISDQRLKENVRDLDDGIEKIMLIKPRKFDWKTGKGKDIKNDRGFIAQEFEEVFPDLIEEWLDQPPVGEEAYKAVRPDLIPVLVKAIQEQQAIITELKARIEQLEAK